MRVCGSAALDRSREGQMRLLFDMDLKDYGECTHTFVRNSARSIIIRDGKLAMIHSKEY